MSGMRRMICLCYFDQAFLFEQSEASTAQYTPTSHPRSSAVNMLYSKRCMRCAGQYFIKCKALQSEIH